MLVANGVAEAFDGDLDDYKDWLANNKTQTNTANVENAFKKNDYAQSKADRQARIVLRRPLVKETEQIEKSLEKLNAEKNTLDARASEGSLYDADNKAELQQLLKRQAELISAIDMAEMRWLKINEQLEDLPEI
jgi:ATP-binding cassette subfamily F protein 3